MRTSIQIEKSVQRKMTVNIIEGNLKNNSVSKNLRLVGDIALSGIMTLHLAKKSKKDSTVSQTKNNTTKLVEFCLEILSLYLNESEIVSWEVL